MKDMMKVAKTLNDNELSLLIDKLNKMQQRRMLRAEKMKQAEQDKKREMQQAREQIESITAKYGVTLQNLGYVQTMRD